MSTNHLPNSANTVYTVMLGVTGIYEIVVRYERLKADSYVGIPLKKDDEYFLKAFSNFLSMKQGEGETLTAFNQRKKEFLTKNYQHFVQYEKFAKQLEMSLMDYLAINMDVAINRPKWNRSAKRLNKELGGQLSDDLVEALSRRIISYSPKIKGEKGMQRINLNTEELIHDFIKRANTPPDGKYFACMLEDFVNMPDASSIVFMPDNGYLQAINANGIKYSYSSSIQLKNNDMDNYATLMHEMHHHVNEKAVRTVQKNGHVHLGHFFNEALSMSDNWLVDVRYSNPVLEDIRLYYEMEAEKLYPNDASKQARYAFTKARGHYISIMLAGNSIQEIEDFYLKTGAKKTATKWDFDLVRSRVIEWYNSYQNQYRYQIQEGGEATRVRINEYLKKHFGADAKMGENLLDTLDSIHWGFLSNNFFPAADNRYRYLGHTKKKAINRVRAELAKHGIILDDDLSISAEDKIILDQVIGKNRLFSDKDFKFCFARSEVNGEVSYEVPERINNYPNRIQKLKDYYQREGIETDVNPQNGKLRIHPNSVKKYEAHLSSTIESLKLDQLRLNEETGMFEADFDEAFSKKIASKYHDLGIEFIFDERRAYLGRLEEFDYIDELTGRNFKLCERIPNYPSRVLRVNVNSLTADVNLNTYPTTKVRYRIDKMKDSEAYLLKNRLFKMGYSVDDIKIEDIDGDPGYKKVFITGEKNKLDNDLIPMFRGANGPYITDDNGCTYLLPDDATIKYTYQHTIVGDGVDSMDVDTLNGLQNRAVRAGINPKDIQLVLDVDGENSRSCLVFPNTRETNDFLRKELTPNGRQLLHKLEPQDMVMPDELKQYLLQKKVTDDVIKTPYSGVVLANDGVEVVGRPLPNAEIDMPKWLTVQEVPDIQNKRMSECAKKLPLEMKLKRVKGNIPYETQYTFKSGVLSRGEEDAALEWYRVQGILFNKVGSQYVMTSESADIFTVAKKLAQGEVLASEDLNKIYRLSCSNSPEAKALKAKMLAQKYNGDNARLAKLIRQFNAVNKTFVAPVSKALGTAAVGLSPTMYNTIADGKYVEFAKDIAVGMLDLVYMLNDIPKLAEKETWTETLPLMANQVGNTLVQTPVELGESVNRMLGDSRFPGDDTPQFGIRYVQGVDKDGNPLYQGEEVDFSESQLLQIYGETENKWYTPTGQYTIEENANKTKKLYIDEKGNLQSMDTVYHWWFFSSEKEKPDGKQPFNGVLKLTTDKIDRNRWNKVSYDDKHNEGEYLIEEGHVKEKRVFNLDGSVSISYYDDTALSDELINLYGEVGVEGYLKDIKIGNVTHTVTMKPLEKEYQRQSEDGEFVILNERVIQKNTNAYPLPVQQGTTKVQFLERYNTEITITTSTYKVPKRLLKDVPLDKLQEEYEKYATKKYYVEGSEVSETKTLVGERCYVTPKLSEEIDKNNLILLYEQGRYLERDINYTDHKISYFDSRGNYEFIQSFEYDMDKKDKRSVSQTAVGLDIPVSDDKGNIILNFDTDLKLRGYLDTDLNQAYPLDKMEFVSKDDKLYLKLESDREIDVSKKISFVNGEGTVHEQLKQEAMAKLTQKQLPFIGTIVQMPLKDKKERQTFLQDGATQIITERTSSTINQLAVVNEQNEKTAQMLIDKKTGVVAVYSAISKDKTGKFVYPKQQYVDEPKNNSDEEINWQKHPESERYKRIMSKVYLTEFMSLNKKSEKESVEALTALVLKEEKEGTFSLKTHCFLENIDYEMLKKHLPADVLKMQMEILKNNSDKLSPKMQTELKKWLNAYEKESSLTNTTLSSHAESITKNIEVPEVDQTLRGIAGEDMIPAISYKNER